MKVLKESSNSGRGTGERRCLTRQDSSSPAPTNPLPARAPSRAKILEEYMGGTSFLCPSTESPNQKLCRAAGRPGASLASLRLTSPTVVKPRPSEAFRGRLDSQRQEAFSSRESWPCSASGRAPSRQRPDAGVQM